MSEKQKLALVYITVLDLKQQESRSWFMNNSLAAKSWNFYPDYLTVSTVIVSFMLGDIYSKTELSNIVFGKSTW